jgi:hypothetical protein
VQVGDVIASINGVATPDLHSAASALRFDEASKTFAIPAGEPITVAVRRGDRQLDLRTTTAEAPPAGTKTPLMALLPDYTVPGVSGLISTSLAGAIGTLAAFFISFGVGRVFTRPGRLEAALAQAQARESGVVGRE